MSRTIVRSLALLLALVGAMTTVAARSGDVSANLVASEVLVSERSADATVVSAITPDDVAKLRSTGSCAGCDLSDADLKGVIAELGDLSYANLAGADLYRARLMGANLTGASLNGVNFAGADLRNARGADLSSATTDTTTVCPSGAAGPCN